MAAAPNYPMPDPAVTRTIKIDNAYNATPPGIIVNPGDTVMFQNNSGADITVQFQPNYTSPAVSSNLSVPNGGESGFVAPSTDAAANYNIYIGGVQQNSNPYVIQVGAGPMFVVFPVGPATQCNYPTVAVPLGNAAAGMGELNMGPNLTSANLTISFGTNPFNPPITAPGGTHSVAPGASAGSYVYTSLLPADSPGPGGTVIIRST
jgi:hypothetical protein